MSLLDIFKLCKNKKAVEQKYIECLRNQISDEQLSLVDQYLIARYSEKVMLQVKKKAFIETAFDNVSETEKEEWIGAMDEMFTPP